MEPKALITGVTGMVGSHLADYLLEHTTWDVVGMLRWQDDLANIQHLLPRANKEDRFWLVYADLRDQISLDHIVRDIKPDYAFHLAAQSYPHTSFTSPLDTLDTNILGTERLLHALRSHAPEAKIHVCSSSEVFGRVPREMLPIDENCPFHPASPYAISKVGTDLIGRFYAEAYGMCVMSTRMFTHTGPRRGDVFAESTFAKQIALVEAGVIDPVIMTGNLKSLRTWSDVRDAVRAYYLLLTHEPMAGAFYNIGGSYTCTVGEMLDTLIGMSKYAGEIEVRLDPARVRPIDADAQIPDCSKFTKHTGWTPEIPFEQTMNDLLEYWRTRVDRDHRLLTR